MSQAICSACGHELLWLDDKQVCGFCEGGPIFGRRDAALVEHLRSALELIEVRTRLAWAGLTGPDKEYMWEIAELARDTLRFADDMAAR